MKKKWIPWGLLCAIILSSCGGQTETAETALITDEQVETKMETIDPNTVDDMPDDLKFNGSEFNLLSPDDYGGISFVEEINGEKVNDVKYDMEMKTEERLDVSILETPSGFWQMVENVNNLVMSGDTTYDSITMMDRFSLQCAMKQCFMPIQNVSYVDLSKTYWGTTLSETLTIGGENFFAVGSFNLYSFQGIACVMFNGDLADRYKIEIPFDAVDEGTWTFDMLESYRGLTTEDLNGDGIMDNTDQYTYGNSGQLAPQMLMASGVKVVVKDESDIPYIGIYGYEKYVSVMERIKSVFYDSGDMFADKNVWSTTDMFSSDKALIHFAQFSTILELREMESDYSILPTPKYDEAQKDYITRTYDTMFTMVPITATDTVKSGAVLEALSSYGYNNLIPAYIETTLQDKYSRDERSVKCIQIAVDTRTIDMGEAFMFDLFGDAAMQNLMYKADLALASHLQSIQNKADDTLRNIVDALVGKE